MRVKLLGDWDGIDYIDGEDIRENFSLPYTHGDYPTLDHIIPRSEGFRRGLTPYEITTPENLKWAKRRNNSKKYNKKL
jgi:5-methylcytosine-specific restriction endonuclease McrA